MEIQNPPPARGGSLARAAAGVAGLGAALYLATMAPTVLWGDDAELQRIVVTGEPRVIGQSSSASHLLWLTIARWLVPATTWLPLDSAGRATLLTALFAAAALVMVFLAAAELARACGARTVLAGLGAAMALGVSHTFWLLAVRPDVYTLQVTLLASAIWCVLRWRATRRPAWLLGAGAAAAAALANHAVIVASLPGLAVLAVALPAPAPFRRRFWVTLALVAAAAILALALAAAFGPPVGALVRTLLQFRPALPRARDVLLVPVYLVYQFPLAWLLALLGLSVLWRRDRGALVGVALLYAGNAALPLLIRVADRFLFFLPSYVPVALLAGLGAGAAPDWWRARLGGMHVRFRGALLAALLLAPLAIYPLAAAAGGALAAQLAPARRLPGRDPVVFYLWPPKTGYSGARTYGEAALSTVAPQAAILADWLPYQTLRYLQSVEGRRPDVLLENLNAGTGEQLRFLLAQDGRRPLYLADASPPPYYDLGEIGRCFAVEREGVVYRLTRRPNVACP